MAKQKTEECFPFNETTLVFKVVGKIFLLVDIHSRPLSFNVKCEPQ
ncbi:MAG: MmcQ/YjbR family DNA-binding protein [Bacteroidota bacterium]|nr:MmcQ/YjbR family DNA-binding protein [Bacteroidota bacterium]